MSLPLHILVVLAPLLLALLGGAFWRMKKDEQRLRHTKRRVGSPPPAPPPPAPSAGYSAQRRRREVYYHSRRKYARPRAQVEKEIARLYGGSRARSRRAARAPPRSLGTGAGEAQGPRREGPRGYEQV